MRSSRRNLGLTPEFSPEPTPPNSDEELQFTEDFQIETTIEENERYAREDEENARKAIEQEEEASDDEILVLKEVEKKKKDIVLSSEEESNDESSSVSSMKIENEDESKFLIKQAKKALRNKDEKLLELILDSMGKKEDSEVTKNKNKENEVNPLKGYKKGNTSRSGMRAFTEFWDNHSKRLDYHLPLTIFNEEWIELDSTVSSNNTSKKKDRITGQLPKSEWFLSFAEWTRARLLMVKYLKNHYLHVDFANDLEEHFEYVQKLSARHGWVTAFRYDIAVRTDVTCNQVNGAPGDPSVKREEFLEDALARTNLLRDGRIMKYDNPYAKGNKKERYSPITGNRYPEGKNHNSEDLDLEEEDYNSTLKVPKNSGKVYGNNRRNNQGKNFNRSPSPYSKDEKGKGKQNPNPNYKGIHYNENYQKNKLGGGPNKQQSSSKEKA